MTRARDLAKGTFSGNLTVDTNTLVVDSANNRVGIGTATPYHPLEIAGGNLWVRQDSNSSAGYGIQFGLVGNHGSYRSAVKGGPETYGGTDSGILTFHTQNGYVVSDTPPERMRVHSSGAVSIGTATIPYGGTRLYLENSASASALFQVNNTHNVSGDVNSQIWLGSNCNNTSSYFLLCGIVGVANQMYVYGNGNIVNTNNSYGAISDVKLKENIIDATSQWDDIKNLTVRKYSMKADNLDAPNRLGVIAQEVEAAGMGGLVFESPDRDLENNVLDTVTKHVNYSILYMKAVKALQEAMTRIETLEANQAAMETRLAALEAV